jgi:hypothetical protein
MEKSFYYDCDRRRQTAQVILFSMNNLGDRSAPRGPGFSFVLWAVTISPILFIVIIISLHRQAIKNRADNKNRIEKNILQLEAKALRAQMNPHFIFTSMNSIKQLIQQKEESKAIIYLNAFSS